MPTARDISGAFDSLAGGAGTAMLPAQGAAERFGTTANMSGERKRGNKAIVLGFVAVAVAASIAGALFTARARREMAQARPANAAPAAAPTASPPSSPAHTAEAPANEAAEPV